MLDFLPLSGELHEADVTISSGRRNLFHASFDPRHLALLAALIEKAVGRSPTSFRTCAAKLTA
jgi:hypothetical protein